MKQKIKLASCMLLLIFSIFVAGCGKQGQNEEENLSSSLKSEEGMTMHIQIGEQIFMATLEDNQAVRELITLMKEAPMTLTLSDYAGFEKVGPLGSSLTTSNEQMTTAAGDIVLYNGNQIVVFYGSNTWSYTKLAHVDDLTGWSEALGSSAVTMTLSIGEGE